MLVIVPVLVCMVLVYYYWVRHKECTAQANIRDNFVSLVRSAAQDNRTFRLSDVTEFNWQQVKGFTGFAPSRQPKRCPFGWDWSSSERQELVSSGLLSILIFFNEGKIAGYIEFRGDQIDMEEFSESLTPDSASFTATQSTSDQFRISLLPESSG